MVLEIRFGFPFIAPDPYPFAAADDAGAKKGSEQPSWARGPMDVVIGAVLMTCGDGLWSIDNLLIADRLRALLA